MKLIAIDTQILVWGVQGRSHSTQKGMIARAKAYFDELVKKDARIIIPTPVAWEYVCWFPIAEQNEQWAILSRRFRLAPFDLRAAQIAAVIERQRLNGKVSKKAKRSPTEAEIGDLTRQQVKVDVQILAIAIAVGAESIITDDSNHFLPLAVDQPIQVVDLHAIEVQTELFE